MADDVTLPGTGVIVAADEVAYSGDTAKIQVVRLVHITGTEGAKTVNEVFKAEDAQHASGDFGIMALAVRKDTATALATADADYIPLIVDASGQLYVNVGSAPAAARTSDAVAVAHQTDAIMNGGTALTPKFANIACAASGNNTLVAAVSAKKIRVTGLFMVASAAVNVYFVDGAGTPVALAGSSTNKIQLAANAGFTLPFDPTGWFETSTTNVALNLNLSAAIAVGGALKYVEV